MNRPAENPQLLHIIGGAGSGKSTFIRYFFQYYLPHYEVLINGFEKKSKASKIHTKAYQRHIVLWSDLRRPEANIQQYIFTQLGKSLHYVTKQLGLTINIEDDCTEDQLWGNISQLASERERGERKWYISWVFDNSDQLNERQQLELVNIILKYVPEEQLRTFGSKLVSNGEGRELWRIIIPIRPETQTNLARFWDPFRNRDFIELNPINHYSLIEKRAKYVYQIVSESRRHHQSDPFRITTDRSDYELEAPKEMAIDLQENIRFANSLGSPPL